MVDIKLVGYGVDTLILNVRYADKQRQPVKQELEEKFSETLDYLQSAARSAETAVDSDWSFLGVVLFVEPHGAANNGDGCSPVGCSRSRSPEVASITSSHRCAFPPNSSVRKNVPVIRFTMSMTF